MDGFDGVQTSVWGVNNKGEGAGSLLLGEDTQIRTCDGYEEGARIRMVTRSGQSTGREVTCMLMTLLGVQIQRDTLINRHGTTCLGVDCFRRSGCCGLER